MSTGSEGAFDDAPGDAEGRQLAFYAGKTGKALGSFRQLGQQHVNRQMIADLVHISARASELHASDERMVDFHSWRMRRLNLLRNGLSLLKLHDDA